MYILTDLPVVAWWQILRVADGDKKEERAWAAAEDCSGCVNGP